MRIEATAEASYTIDVSPDESRWFEDEVEYDQADWDTTALIDAFGAAPNYLRRRMTEAATAGATANVYFAHATR